MDSSPASLFDSYEQDFQQILQSIRQKLEGDGSDQHGGTPETAHLILFSTGPHSPPEQKKAVLRRVEMELDEADEMVCTYSLSPCIVDRLTHTKLTWSQDRTNGDRDPGNTPVHKAQIPIPHPNIQSRSRAL